MSSVSPPGESGFFEPGEATRRPVRVLFATSAIWLLVAVSFGLIDAIELVSPDTFADVPWLVFGRIRPTHVNLVLFGFLTPGLLGAFLYIVPKICRTELYAPRLALAAGLAWNLFLVGVVVTLLSGLTQAREYAELVWPLDVALLVLYGMLTVSLLGTIARRREEVLFVPGWYLSGALVWTAIVYFTGNAMWYPRTGSIGGINDTILLWFYGHNVFGLVVTPLAAGAAIYIVSHATRAPIYSHKLSLLAFWMLLLVYTHTGTHHLLQAPVPQWLKTIAVVDSVALLVPVFAFLANVWLPLKDRMLRIHASIGAKFVFVGTVWYFVTCVQGPFQSLPSVQRITHFNNWVVGHAHIALLGFAGFIGIGAVYYILPYVTRRLLWSERLARVQYWLVLLGLLGFFVVLTAAGLVQGHAWRNGETVYRVLPQISLYMLMRALLGVLIVVSAVIYVVNVLMTMRRGREVLP